MPAPVWAKSMISNYRRMYKDKYGIEAHGTDDEIWQICEAVFDDSDTVAQDNARVEAIHDLL